MGTEETTAEILCPECAQGKCQNCTGDVLIEIDDKGEEWIDCECENHG
jgi:hypothetical protein